MWQKYSAPLSDADSYLKRIGMERKTACRDYLDDLVFAHQCSVPFETTLLSEYGKAIEIDTETLYRKIVTEKRGGYCFELNGLFMLLLRDLGFDAYSCPCRVLLGASDSDPLPPVLHRGTIVITEGRPLFCDVGFGGPMPAGAIELEKQGIQEIRGEKFLSIANGRGCYRLKRINSKGELENVLMISVDDWEACDFIAPNLYTQQPGSPFWTRQASLRRPDGYVSLNDNIYTEASSGNIRKKEVSREEGREILRKVFGL